LIAAIARPTVSTFSCDIAYSAIPQWLRRERHGSGSGERASELGEDRQIAIRTLRAGVRSSIDRRQT
jgi:hypothetical protein